MLVFVEKITPRLIYTFDFVFAARGVNYSFCTSKTKFEEGVSATKLNYSVLNIDSLTIEASHLLFEDRVEKQKLEKESFEGIGCLAFDKVIDPIASVFYILSRYEEYVSDSKDHHGRFPFEESVLAKFNWIESAICDHWANKICSFLEVKIEKDKSVKIIPTFDIDNTYAFLNKDKKRRVLSSIKDLLFFNFKRLKERNNAFKQKADPYDTFARIKEIAKTFSGTKIFWLVESDGKFDRNVRIDNPSHIALIQEIKNIAKINLHPSYDSNSDSKKIQIEKEKLEKVLGEEVDSSRQHFLKLDLPKTYRALINNGFSDDYTMGFAEHSGFRSGTARTHLWFDLLNNEITELHLHPFVYMDGSLKEYMSLSIEESKKKILKLYREIYDYGGNFIFIWHNETIGDYDKWGGWSEVLNYTLALNNE